MRILPCLLVAAAAAAAETVLPSIIGERMLLQREAEAPVWGWDEPGREVAVSFRGATVRAVAGADGRFQARVPTGAAGGPFALEIAGSTRIALQDVLVGEVWIAGGQSNMWWQLKNCSSGAEAIAASADAQLRWYDANTAPAEAGYAAGQPARSIATSWVASAPEAAPDFAGTAWHFARGLRRELGVPVGIVHLAVPGTAIEPWMRPALLAKQFPDAVELDRLRQEAWPARLQAWEATVQAWKAGGSRGPEPQKPAAPGRPGGSLWNGMVAPALPFAARGFIWWQGESNADRFQDYRVRFPAMIADWRQQWGLDAAPFIFAELANFGTRDGRAVDDAPWPAQREAQREALMHAGVLRVSMIDVLASATWEIHPPDKALAGERFLRAALARVYGRDIAWSGPDAAGYAFADGACTVAMRDADGLRVRGDGPARGFALAGADRVWHAAEAAIDGESVRITSAAVPAPVAVRYGWMNNPDGNLENAAGLPAWPFRSDDWPLCQGD